jgi:CBS domain-containing protein
MKSTVKDIMTTRVIWVRKDASFRDMAAALHEHRVSAFPVLDEAGKVIGVVSEADMLPKEALGQEPEGMPGMITGMLRRKEHAKARGTTAGDLMTSPPVTITPDDTVEHAARLMYTRKVKRLPVIDANGHLAGIISRADVLSVFDRADTEIRTEITDEIMINQFLIDPKAFAVTVKDGVVTLAGKPETTDVGHELVRRARHVQGVVAVRDRLTYPPREPRDDRFDVLARFPIDLRAREEETMNAIVRDVMSTQVVAVKRGASFKEMAASLRQYRVSAFPVIDDDQKVIGVVSEADLLAKEALTRQDGITAMMHHKEHQKAKGLTAGDLMTHPPVTVRPDDTLEHAARMMYTLQVKRLPVVDAGGHLVGIVSRADVLAVFDRPDAEILAEIVDDVILHEFLIDPAVFRVTVAEGVVTLQGSPETADLGHDLVEKIRHIRGVVAIHDQLVYPPAERSVAGLYI